MATSSVKIDFGGYPYYIRDTHVSNMGASACGTRGVSYLDLSCMISLSLGSRTVIVSVRTWNTRRSSSSQKIPKEHCSPIRFFTKIIHSDKHPGLPSFYGGVNES